MNLGNQEMKLSEWSPELDTLIVRGRPVTAIRHKVLVLDMDRGIQNEFVKKNGFWYLNAIHIVE